LVGVSSAFAPRSVPAISSPLCFTGSKAVNICSGAGSVSDSITVRPSLFMMRTALWTYRWVLQRLSGFLSLSSS